MLARSYSVTIVYFQELPFASLIQCDYCVFLGVAVLPRSYSVTIVYFQELLCWLAHTV